MWRSMYAPFRTINICGKFYGEDLFFFYRLTSIFLRIDWNRLGETASAWSPAYIENFKVYILRRRRTMTGIDLGETCTYFKF